MSLIRIALAVSTLALSVAISAADGPSVLVFSETKGYRHGSIPLGIEAIKKIGADNGFSVVASEDPAIMSDDGLKPFTAAVFVSTTGAILNDAQHEAFIKWFKNGKGWVGIHAAADCEYNWPWYGGLVGAWFKRHPAQQLAKINVIDKTFPGMADLPDVWERKDEWYDFKAVPKDVHVLLKIDEKSYKDASMGDDHPMAWWHLYEGGRAFYTELGHTNESYSEPLYLKHITGAILWAIGKVDETGKAK